MVLIDKLIQMDTKTITEMPKREVEVPRLTKVFGESFKVTCQAIDGESYADIQRVSIDLNKKGDVRNINLFDIQVLTVIDGMVEPRLKDVKLLKHFGCVTPKELVKKLFEGRVFYNERLGEQGTIQITCYDDAIRLAKSKGTYNFKGKLPEAPSDKIIWIGGFHFKSRPNV